MTQSRDKCQTVLCKRTQDILTQSNPMNSLYWCFKVRDTPSGDQFWKQFRAFQLSFLALFTLILTVAVSYYL